MSDELGNFRGKHINYNKGQWKKTGTFNILNNISEPVTLVQLMDSDGGVYDAVNVFGKWIFDSNCVNSCC